VDLGRLLVGAARGGQREDGQSKRDSHGDLLRRRIVATWPFDVE
jgi:hypothetical protein